MSLFSVVQYVSIVAFNLVGHAESEDLHTQYPPSFMYFII